MATRVAISEAFHGKGKTEFYSRREMKLLTLRSFGWANASYVVGLQIVNAHMKRALGAMTPWDTFYQATKTHVDDEIISEAVEFE
jgi:hypothetical protein